MNSLTRLPRLLLPITLAALALLAGLTILTPSAIRAAGPTNVPGGTLNTNTTWTLANSPYIIQGGVYVGNGVTLTIEPGVEVRFDPGTFLSPVSGGTLVAEGTVGQPIHFTSNAGSPAAGDWRYLYFYDGSHVRLDHCDIGYAGGGVSSGAVEVRGADVQINHCRIHDSADNGLYIFLPAAGGLIDDTQIEDNALNAIYVEQIGRMPSLHNLSLAGNGQDVIYLDSGAVTGQAVLDGSPEAVNGAPYQVASISVGAGETLTITPGTEVQILDTIGTNNISVGDLGTLIAEGTLNHPITLTSDTNSVAPSGWTGVDLTGDVTARLAHCNIAYAGDIGLDISAASDVPDIQVRRCRIHHGAEDGIYIFGIENDIRLEDTRIDHNGDVALRVSGPRAFPGYRNLTLDSNGLDAVFLNGNSGEFDNDQHVTLDGSPNGTNGAPFVFENTNYSVRDGSSITVKPGTELRFGSGVSLDVNSGAALLAEGTQANPISFTSHFTNPAAGDWGRLLLRSGSQLRLAHCVIEFAGSSNVYALEVETSDAEMRRCHLHDNQNGAVWVQNAAFAMQFNRLEDNEAGVTNSTPATQVDARYNWWGDASGPFHASLNPAGQGNAVSNGVLFDPWLEDPAAAALLLSPDNGGNTGPVTVQVEGQAPFSPGATIKLTRAGQADIVGQDVTVQPDGTLRATFPLSGTLQGAWDVVLNDGGLVTLPDGFTVEAGDIPEVWVQLITHRRMRTNRDGYFYLVYGNNTNVDAPAAQVRFTLPAATTLLLPPPVSYTLESLSAEGLNLLSFYLPSVPAGSTTALPVRVRNLAPGNQTGELWLQTLPGLHGFLGQPPDPDLSASVQSLVTTTTSLSTVVRLTDGGTTYDIGYLLDYSAPGDAAPPDASLVETSDDVRVDYTATVNVDSLVLNSALAPGSTSSKAVGFAKFSWQAKKALQNWREAQAVSDKVLVRAVLIDCLLVRGLIDEEQLRRSLGLNEMAIPTNFVKSATDAIPGAGLPAAYLKALDGVSQQAFELQLAKYAKENPAPYADAGLDFSGSLWNTKTVMDELYRHCLPDLTDPPNPPQPSRPPQFIRFLGHVWNDFSTWFVANVLDPNEKVGPEGAGDDHYVRGDAPLTYVIYFENVPTATASVQEIFISDQLDAAALNLETLAFGPVTFGGHQAMLEGNSSAFADVDLRPEQDLIVRITADLNKISGELTWHFIALDPDTGLLTEDPDAGFLPPNADGDGEGSVMFTIWPKAGLATGTQITNAAEIIFELNAPIVTEAWTNQLDNHPPASAVQALPAVQGGASFTVSWGGTDTGAGIRDYTIYFARDDGEFEPWLVDTTATSAVFKAPGAGRYTFYSQARDAVGLQEAAPGAPDATTRVPSGLYLPLLVR